MNVLILAPHTDDGEIGCGGAIARHVADGDSVYYLAFTALDSDVLREEVRQATRLLGLPPSHLIIKDHTVRRFSEERQAILDTILSVRGAIEPDVVYMPCLHDVHQDHRTVAIEAVRGLRNTTLLGYEVPRNNLKFRAQAFVKLTEEQVALKVQSVRLYQSQTHRTYTTEIFIWSQARFRGTQIDAEYAEAYEVIRWVR